MESVVLYFLKESLPVKKYLSLDNEISFASAQGQLRHTKKLHVSGTSRDDAVSIFRGLNFHDAYCSL